LVLDEPTNDLDMDTLDLLQEVLSDYEGTILIVSHDRDFLDRVVTSIVYMPGDGTAVEYAGSYSDFLNKHHGNHVEIQIKKKNEGGKVQEASREVSKPLKLSYNQQRLIEVLPQEIEKMEAELAEIKLLLNDANLYVDRPDEFNRLTMRYSELTADIENKENQWLEIQSIKEDIESRA